MTNGAGTALGLPLLLFQKLNMEWQDVEPQRSQNRRQHFSGAGLRLFSKCSFEVLYYALVLAFIHFR
jgi:hypothetical protein